MYLQSLELNGFKSFPDKISLEFDKGLTCVVGPNGSGKSNIGDAVRWVLGEQSSKSLRGSNMQDVIFSGTQSRKAGKFAQVTLNIENSDRALDRDDDLVSVSRKLYKNGDSEYIINGEQVRLRDVLELFMDTGLGKDGYSIIGQGKIADIVSSKSTDRREIFEEAAGISKFRYKKQESERKLAHAEDNILRLNDILSELESRVGSLKTQSEKAKKYLQLRDVKKDLDVSLSVYKYNDLNEKLSGLEDKLLSAQSEYEALSRELDELDDTIDKGNLERAKFNDKIDALRKEIHSIEQQSGELNARTAVLQNDIEHINSQIVDNTLSIKELEGSSQDFEKKIEEKEAELSKIREQLDKTNKQADETQQKLSHTQTLESEFDKDLKQNSQNINSLYIRKSELEFTIAGEKRNIEEYKKQISEGERYIAEAEEEQKQVLKERAEINSALMLAEEKLSELTNRISGFTKLYESKESQYEAKNAAFNSCRLKIGELKNRLQILSDLENSMEGFSSSVKQIIKASKEGRISGISGSVAQLITVDSKYSIAIETALGAAMQNIVVENEEIAKRCIRYLKEIRGGRATFLPLNVIKPRTLDLSRAKLSDGYISTAEKLVSVDAKYQNIISNLLGRIVVAEDLDSGTVIAKSNNYAFKVVTLDGQVINAGGSFTGGSASRSAGILSRKNEMDKINGEIKSCQTEEEKLTQELTTLKEEITKLQFDIDGEREIQSEHKEDKFKFESELTRLNDLLKQYDSRLDDYDSQIEDFRSRITRSENIESESVDKLTETINSISDYEKQASEGIDTLNSYKTKREELSSELSSLKIESISLSKDEQSVLLAIEQIKQSAENSNSTKLKLSIKIMEQQEQISQIEQEIKEIEQSIESSKNDIENKEKEIVACQAQYNTLEAKSAKLRSYQKIKISERETAAGELERSSEKKLHVENEIDTLLNTLYDDYELTRSEALELAHPIEDIAEASREQTKIRNKIRALGSVNIDSIEEYKEVSERYEFLSTQLKDVLKSKSELEKLIASLTEEMIAIFSDSFNKINDNFKVIFSELFGGGSGELVLTDPENILESGIEIKVAPPGKVIKNLLSLSGGEQAFVAIAIYFAILKVKPSPFCILDEIEAALDDVNVTKYAQYLRNFSDKTQFILISHRRGTMEESDVLYGVTMQEKGVSKLLRLNTEQTQIDMNQEE
ncbi:MAG: chromosome segregation protein SMC [Ruminococcus sp.]|nr:chromosome segregation protein SMC [Ruminococcus sp.]